MPHVPQVLIVDDDVGIREVAREMLEDAGFVVVQATDGQAALDALRTSEKPLVVLLDLMMPRTSGMTVLECVATDKRLARHAYVRWSVSRAPLSPRVAPLVRWSIPKPFRVDELLDTVAEAAAHLDRGQSAQ